jgi:hypothetical protein
MSSGIHYKCIKTISCNCPKCFHESYKCLKNKSCKCLVCITGNLPICGEKNCRCPKCYGIGAFPECRCKRPTKITRRTCICNKCNYCIEYFFIKKI